MLQQIRFDGAAGMLWERLFRIVMGNMIVTALGFVPGAFAFVVLLPFLFMSYCVFDVVLRCICFTGLFWFCYAAYVVRYTLLTCVRAGALPLLLRFLCFFASHRHTCIH